MYTLVLCLYDQTSALLSLSSAVYASTFVSNFPTELLTTTAPLGKQKRFIERPDWDHVLAKTSVARNHPKYYEYVDK